MNKSTRGFTLIEILIAMSVLIVGLVGILALFPVGLDANRRAIEDTNAALIAESAYASLRASARRAVPGAKLIFFHDGINTSANSYPADMTLTYETSPNILKNRYFNIPGPSSTSDTAYPLIDNGRIAAAHINDFCKLGRTKFGDATTDIFDLVVGEKDEDQLSQYSFNIELYHPDTNPRGLFNVRIRVARGDRLIKNFYSQIMIPLN